MRPSEYEAIRPNLKRAVGDINDYLKSRQSVENDKELHNELNRLAALPEGTPSTAKLKTPPPKYYKQVVRSMLGTPSKQEGRMQQYRIREKVAMRHPPIARPQIENTYPWRRSAAQAASDLYDCGWTKEAAAITEVSSGLPTGPIDGNHPEIFERQLEAIRDGAERIKAILEACLEPQPSTDKHLDARPGGRTPSQAKQNKKGVTAKNEERIEKAIRALPRGSEQRAIAEKAGVGVKTVGRSNAYRSRMALWGAVNPGAMPTKDDPDAVLDVKEFINATKEIAHHKTRQRVEYLMGTDATREQLIARLVAANQLFDKDGTELAKLPDETAKTLLRVTAEEVSRANR